MRKILPVIMILAITIVACNNNHNLQSIKALSNSLERVNGSIGENINQICAALDEKLKDPQTMVRAGVWTPRGFAIKGKSDTFYSYVEEVKAQIKLLPEDDVRGAGRLLDKEGNKLFNKLVVLERSVIRVMAEQPYTDNPGYQAMLNKDADLFKKKMHLRFKTTKDSVSDIPIDASSWMKRNFGSVTPVLALAMLNKVQNDVLITTNDLLEYCNANAWSATHDYETFKPLISLDRSYVKSGQTIEVSAGVASFSTSAKPVITIDGKRVKVDEEGVATWNFYAKKKAGHYTVPVRIEFSRPDGERQSVNKNLKYTVGE